MVKKSTKKAKPKTKSAQKSKSSKRKITVRGKAAGKAKPVTEITATSTGV